jgi:hypothetical protein
MVIVAAYGDGVDAVMGEYEVWFLRDEDVLEIVFLYDFLSVRDIEVCDGGDDDVGYLGIAFEVLFADSKSDDSDTKSFFIHR